MGGKRFGAVFILLGVCLAFLVLGCAFFKQSEGRIVTEIVAQDVGYLIAREDPQLATEILKHIETMPDFENWAAWVIAQLVHDEFLRMNFEKLASLVEVDLEGVDAFKERMGIVAPILRSFAEGIRMGLKESRKSGFGNDYLLLAGFAWEGELNPNEFDDWELLAVQSATQGYFWVFIANPDRASPIDVVVLQVDLSSSVMGYRYFRDGEPYLYVFDGDKDKYVRYRLTREEKESCVKCHGGDKPEKDSLHGDMEGI